MKKIIAIAAIIASAQVAAFDFGDSNTNTTGQYRGNGDFVGNGTGEGEATFSMEFKGRGRTNGDFKGNGDTNGNYAGYNAPYHYAPYGYAPQQMPAPVAPTAQ